MEWQSIHPTRVGWMYEMKKPKLYLSRCALINLEMEILLSSPYHTFWMLFIVQYNITKCIRDYYKVGGIHR